MNQRQKHSLIRILLAAFLLAASLFIPADGVIRLFLFLVPYGIVGYDILKKAFRGITHGHVLDENFLMAVSTVGAFILGDYPEGVAVMLFYQIGELFQSVAIGKSRRSIGALMDLRPDVATRVTEDGREETVDPSEIAVGEHLLLRPGEKIPIDGVIVSGRTSLDFSALTGESLPRGVSVSDEVPSGAINISGAVTIRTTRPFGEDTASRILDLVENAGSRKSKSEHFISRFARIYTPIVCLAALFLAAVPPLCLVLTGRDAAVGTWIYRALTFLVISCPCALVVSIPLTFFSGLGGAGKSGILIKGSNYMEALSKVRTVVFDKTGTMTHGVFKVCAVHHSPMDDARLLELAALAESFSEHPIARSLREAAGGLSDTSRVTDATEIAGFGISATVDGRSVFVGNDRLMERIGVAHQPCHSVGTIVHVAADGAYAGHIVIADVVKKGAAEAIAALKSLGVRQTVMLTGDGKRTADAVAGELGIDDVRAELLPDGKVREVEALLSAPGTLAFCGDGINDAPVLMRADVGIAMGALGSDAAIEAADVVLMDDDPGKIARAIGISRKCLRIVYENTVFAIGVKLACLILGAFGITDMWAAIFADVGVMVLAVLNAVRALHYKGGQLC